MSLKISPLATSNAGYPGQSLTVGQPAHANGAIAAAVAAAEGQPAPQSVDPQVARVQADARKIRMRTRTPSAERGIVGGQAPAPEAVPLDPATAPISPEAALSAAPEATPEPALEAAPSATLDSNKPAEPVEDTRPISPQFAALAKQRRAIQVKEMELQAREKALAEKASAPDASQLIARLQSEPLSVLQEHGVTYDQLTEAILSGDTKSHQQIKALEQQLKSMQDKLDQRFTDQATQAEQAALAEMRREATRFAAEGEDFELIRSNGRIPDVMKLIHQTYKESGEVLDVREAMQLVEDELLTDSLRVAQLKKVQNKLKPAAPAVTETPAATPVPKPLTTLTSRGQPVVSLSRRERAIMAMNNGTKK